MAAPKLTPMFEQYLQIKQDHPDALLFYRMGDFYEMFFEDAETAARALQITLTSRNPNDETRIPMCGVPHHAAEGYLSQLLEQGYKVAICDQIEDPKQAKGLVKRAVTRVLTPGTVTEDANLSGKTNNFLAALYWDAGKGAGGLAWADVSTGDFSGIQGRKEAELWQWAMKLAPSELLLPQDVERPAEVELAARITPLPLKPHFDTGQGRELLLAAQGVADLGVLDLDNKPELVRACGALLAYLRQTQMQDSRHLNEFKPLNPTRHLLLDEVTERNLELFRTLSGGRGKGTLVHVLDATLTPMGGRLLATRLRQPWRETGPIEKTLDAVALLHGDDGLRGELRALLDGVYDLERLSTRACLGRAMPKDLHALAGSLAALPGLRALLAGCDLSTAPELQRLAAQWDDLEDLGDLLEGALADTPPQVITEGGIFSPGHDPRLDELIELTEHGQATVQQLLDEEREQSAIPKLKLGFNKVFGYYFEVSKAHKGQVPEHFVRRQTLVNSERYITPRLKELEDRLLGASEERKTLEYELFQELRKTVARARTRLMFMASAVAALDFWQGLAETARTLGWTRPELHTGNAIGISGGRHPVVEAFSQGNFVPNDLTLDDKRRILLVTGPNMAGKSTVLRQTAIIVLLAQMGSFVPAKTARIGLADRVFSRVGASDNLAQGQSTFMVEMTETARILRQATKKSLVILDEIGRGTSTFDGLALAWAVVEELARRGDGGVRTLFATHYHELTRLEGRVPGLRNLNIAVKEWKGDIVFLRRLVPGPADRSYGVEVARLAGVPRPVVLRAREILDDLEARAQAGGGLHAPEPRASQGALPGLVTSPPGADPGSNIDEHPVLLELEALDVDGLTPIDALTLLHRLKQRLHAHSEE